MRKKPLFVVAFLLMLYISPMIFISSYGGVAIPAEQNPNKDFVISEDWYDESWHYRKSITIEQDSGIAGFDYQVLVEVTYDSHMKTDFGDIRFTDDDNVTLLDYWLETKIDSTNASFWVEVKDYQEGNAYVTIYMYYGNEEVSTTSNGTATFLVYEDWASESVRTDVWDVLGVDGSISYSAVDANHGYVARFEGDVDGTYHITSDYDTASPIAVMFRSNIEECGAGNTGRQGSGYVGAYAFNLVQSTSTGEIFYVYDDDANQDSQAMTLDYFDAWVTFQITRDGTNSKLYADTVLIETASCDPDIITTNPATSIMVTDSEDDLYSDWVVVRKFVSSEPYVGSFGEEEDNFPPPDWQDAGTAIIIFEVPVFTGSLDALLIFLGLIMIPASTLYFVKGGKDEMSSDKVFYCLIAFVLGWALFLGGIYG